MTATLPQGYHNRFRQRVVQDAVAEATAVYWERRAAMFRWARPRPGDWPGQATRNELAEQDRRLARIAEACHNRAWLALHREA